MLLSISIPNFPTLQYMLHNSGIPHSIYTYRGLHNVKLKHNSHFVAKIYSFLIPKIFTNIHTKLLNSATQLRSQPLMPGATTLQGGQTEPSSFGANPRSSTSVAFLFSSPPSWSSTTKALWCIFEVRNYVW